MNSILSTAYWPVSWVNNAAVSTTLQGYANEGLRYGAYVYGAGFGAVHAVKTWPGMHGDTLGQKVKFTAGHVIESAGAGKPRVSEL